ncbi:MULTISPECIES: RNA polymerase sigma factor [Streptomyces]|uniref:RNA polymerase sigma factor n=1 Tax=Streptomyces TaxID=1883 RepID=UPI000F42E848|nr:sigma-70 family RNA polymerase sigma factor [Streptomyces sp. ADI95-16]AYV32390.1 RNA polymerase sigma factor SigX [Streptomyces sp. ADI95-16]
MTEVPALPAVNVAMTTRSRFLEPQQQEPDELEAFYRAEMPRMTVFLLNLGASVYEAADAAHEAFLTLLPDRWREIEYPRAWLRTVAYRKYLQQATSRTQPLDPVPERPGGTCPVDLVLLTEQETTVRDALGQLSPAEREAMAWKLDGFTHQDAAQALGKDPAAVRQAYLRARKRLVSILELKKEAKSGA